MSSVKWKLIFLMVFGLVCSGVFFSRPQNVFAAVCPAADADDGAADGVITISAANATWTADGSNLGVFDCSGLTIHVTNNKTLTLISYDNGDVDYTNDNGVNITAAALIVDLGATISADGKGFAGGGYQAAGRGTGGGGAGAVSCGSCWGGGGAAHGGVGGSGGNTSNAGLTTYGSLTNPVSLGSGGGGTNVNGGAGGGAIKFVLTGNADISGTISANGSQGTDNLSGNVMGGGGGSGGSVNITAASLSGNGTVSASGGRGGNAVNAGGGGGGGGRVFMNYTTSSSFGGTVSVNYGAGGTGGTVAGSPGIAGTALIENSDGDLLIPCNNGILNSSDRASWSFRDLTINGDVTFKASTTSLFTISASRNTTFASGITIYTTGYYSNDSNGVGVYFNLTGDVSIPASTTISADGLGYAGAAVGNNAGSGTGKGGAGQQGCNGCGGGGGGAYGDVGGNGGNKTNAGTTTYGSATNPVDLGSGGGAAHGAGGAGGGAIKILTTGTLNILGTITANGNNGATPAAGTTMAGGGGSGGSVNLTAASLTGNGIVRANGGNGGSSGSIYSGGGGGGGGRISMNYTVSSSFSGTVSVNYGSGGTGSSTTGANGTAGTAFIENSDGDWVIPCNNGTWNYSDRASWSFRDLTLNGGITFKPTTTTLFTISSSRTTTIADNITIYTNGYYSTDSNGVGVFLNLTGNVSIPASTTISADGKGYAGGVGATGGAGTGKGGAGQVPCGGCGGGGGAGYGGAGGNGGNKVNAGITYGSATNPVDLGSGGGGAGGNGGAGGGAIKIITTGTLNILGTISTNGVIGGDGGGGNTMGGGGGSGGSVNLTAASLTGNGIVRANGASGGIGGNAGGGGGGGGRISLRYSSNSLTTPLVSAGLGGFGPTISGSDGSAGVLTLIGIPALPSSLAQYKSDGTTAITTGASTNETTVVLKTSMSDGDGSDTLTPKVEVQRIGTAFTNVPTATGSGVAYSGTPVTGSVTVSGLTDTYLYHWQTQVCDAGGNCSSWASFGGNAESSTDFSVLLNLAPDTPSSLGSASMVDGSFGSNNQPTLAFTLSDQDVGNTVKYQIQIDDTANFSSPVTDYTSALAAVGARSFTVGQAAGSGTYTTGAASQTLADGSYYWRVKAIDNSDAASSFTTANSGNIAFKVDTTAPTTPGTPSTTSPTASTTQNWSWTASTDLLSGIASYSWRTTGTSVTSGSTATNSLVTNFTQGVYAFFVKAIDAVGNNGAESQASLTVDTTGPTITSVLSTPSSTGTTITWTTNEDASSIVDYGLTNSYGTSTSETDTSPRVQSHTKTLSGLLSCVTYHYRVRSKDAVLNETTDSDNTFTTTGCTGTATAVATAQITTGAGGTLTLLDGNSLGITLTVPAGFGGSDANFQIHQLNKDEAIANTSVPTGYLLVNSYIYELRSLTGVGTAFTTFTNPLTVLVAYSEADLAGISEADLQIWRYDGASWIALTGCVIDTTNNTITCSTSNFSTFGLFGKPPGTSSGTATTNLIDGSIKTPTCGDQAPGPKTPWLYGAIANSKDSVTLYFTDADDPVNSYSLVYGTKSGEYKYGAANIGGKGMRTYTVKSLSPNTTYYFRIRGVNGCRPGELSNEISVKTRGYLALASDDGVVDIEMTPVEKEKTTPTPTPGKNDERVTDKKTTTEEAKGYVLNIKVKDNDNKPVAEAKVTIHSKVQTGITDKDGVVTFKNVEEGAHKVQIASKNYQGEQSINVTGDTKEFDLSITLEMKSGVPVMYTVILVGVFIAVIAVLIYLLLKKKS